MLQKNIINNFSFSQDNKNVINEYIYLRYKKNISIKKLIKNKSTIIDQLIKNSWAKNNLEDKDISLIAVGGYGRSELFPYSDIDILILINNYENKDLIKNIENFIAEIWHFKVAVGHSVRTIKECIYVIKDDVTIYTNLLDCRFITGNKDLYNNLLKNIKNNSLWSKEKFLSAKKIEQKNRYNKSK